MACSTVRVGAAHNMPSAAITPAWGNTRTRVMPARSATSAACCAPPPPAATSRRVGRVEPALEAAHLQRLGHRRCRGADDGLGRVLGTSMPKGVAASRFKVASAAAQSKRHAARELRRQTAQHAQRIGQRRAVAAQAVGRRARPCALRARTQPQRATGQARAPRCRRRPRAIRHPRNAARRLQVADLQRLAEGRPAVLDDADVGAGAADVDRPSPRPARRAPTQARGHAFERGARPRHRQTDRPRRHVVPDAGAAFGAHQERFG